MSDPLFFGYGSLVNLATHDYTAPRVATLTGWRRVWRQTDLRPAAFLSVEQSEGAEIEGVVAAVPGADWKALDTREAAYIRRDVTDAVVHAGSRGPVAVYQVDEPNVQASHPILLSYLDVVVQGYLAQFGAAGVVRFFQTTDGWDTPILNDRAAPQYPRHQDLSQQERALVDQMLALYGAPSPEV